jgi:hypothetical protein
VAAHHRRARQGGAGRHRMTANVCELRYDEHMTKERGAGPVRNSVCEAVFQVRELVNRSPYRIAN